MRPSLCAAALALLPHCFAVPSFRSSGNGSIKQPAVQPEPQDEETLKYFHEPGTSETLAHYDRRFFSDVATDEERMDTQSHMVRAYLTFFREHKLDTWIAHGTLLGWWWNGKRLPWDVDLDTQVSHSTLLTLGSKYNQTHYKYVSPSGAVHRTYLLDVNAYISERAHGNGMNVIDARWIDMRNGLYIDITGLSEMRAGIWACKNNHEYSTKTLWPMRETVFEGVQATVPFEYDEVLRGEYMEGALVRTQFNGHNWDAKTREWVKSEQRARDDERERERIVAQRREKSKLKLEQKLKLKQKLKQKERQKDKGKAKEKAKEKTKEKTKEKAKLV